MNTPATIIAHRGFWKNPTEKNTLEAFTRALDAGFGIETDIRDYQGRLVIAHDPPTGDEMPFEDFLKLYKKYPSSPRLALNIKSTGLSVLMQKSLERFEVKNYFIFDMGMPDILSYLQQSLTTYSRVSELEPATSPLVEKTQGVWLDILLNNWPTEDVVAGFLKNKKEVCLVSPELHRREGHEEYWARFKKLSSFAELSLCTDFPDQAEKFLAK